MFSSAPASARRFPGFVSAIPCSSAFPDTFSVSSVIGMAASSATDSFSAEATRFTGNCRTSAAVSILSSASALSRSRQVTTPAVPLAASSVSASTLTDTDFIPVISATSAIEHITASDPATIIPSTAFLFKLIETSSMHTACKHSGC